MRLRKLRVTGERLFEKLRAAIRISVDRPALAAESIPIM